MRKNGRVNQVFGLKSKVMFNNSSSNIDSGIVENLKSLI